MSDVAAAEDPARHRRAVRHVSSLVVGSGSLAAEIAADNMVAHLQKWAETQFQFQESYQRRIGAQGWRNNSSCSANPANAMPSPISMILLIEIKGEIRRVPKAAMAFDHRDVNFEMSIVAHWTKRAADDANVRWARNVWTAAQPYVSAAVYTNHLSGDETIDRVRDGYGKSKYEQLIMLKAKYDPDNLFRSNHNILPRRL